MVYIFKDRLIRVEWTIYKGISPVKEDFSRSNVKVFLLGNREKYLLQARADKGTLYVDIPSGLEEGTYSIEAIWVKNMDHVFDTRSVCRSKKEDLFSITEFEDEATNIGEGVVVLKVKTSTATYGYDGLSSYELAVLRGDWNGTEGEWLKHERYVSVLDSRGDSEVDTMSQKAITDELEAQDNAIEDIREDTEKLDNRVEKAEDKVNNMGDVVDEIKSHAPVSARPAGFKPDIDLTPEITVDRAWRDHEGNVIRDTYITRRGLRNEIIDITNQQVTDLKPGSVDPDDLSEATKQLIGNKSITNLPDEEDITVTDNQTLKLKDKEYAPKDYSGMGRVYLRKHYVDGVNTLTQHMMRKPNTIYIIQYDYCLAGQTIEVPENCVLEFQGGSFRNGNLVLNGSYIRGAFESFKSSLTVSGSVKNDKVFTEWWEMPEKDCYSQFKDIIRISNNSLVPIFFRKGKYVFKNDNKHETITQSIDFNDSTITLDTNGFEHFQLKISNSKYEDVDSEDLEELSNAISNYDKSNPIFRKYKNSFLDVKSNEVELMRFHPLVSDPILKEEILYIDINGFLYNEPYNDTFTATSAKFINCDTSSYFKNLLLKIKDTFNGNQSGGYRYIGFLFIYNANLIIDNIQLSDPNIENYRLSIFNIRYGYNYQMTNCNITNTRNNQILINNDKSAYSIDGEKIIKWTMSNLSIGNLDGNAWGATGCNYITDWIIKKSSLSRVDVHHMLNNLSIFDSVIGNKGITYTGFGKIIVENSKFNSNILFSPRADYGGYFDGDIIIKDCTWDYSNTNDIFMLYLSVYNFNFQQASKRTDYLFARNFIVDGLRLIGKNVKAINSIRTVYQNNNNDILIIRKRNFPKLTISDIRSNDTCIIKIIDVFYHHCEVYKKDTVTIDVSNCDFSANNDITGLNVFYLQGHTYDEYLDRKDDIGCFVINLSNCKMTPMISWTLNTKVNINSGTVGLTAGKARLNNKFYIDNTRYNINNATITPNLLLYPSMSSAICENLIVFNNCVFSFLEGSDISAVINYYSFSNYRIFSNRNNIKCIECTIDKKLSDLLGVNKNFTPNTMYDSLRNIPYYVRPIEDGENFYLKEYLDQNINKFRINCVGKRLNIIIPDSTKLNNNQVYFQIENANPSINFISEVEDQVFVGIPRSIGVDFNGQELVLNFNDSGAGMVIKPQILSGSSDNRATLYNSPLLNGTFYFDTTLNKPIWWTGTNWVDATGATV